MNELERKVKEIPQRKKDIIEKIVELAIDRLEWTGVDPDDTFSEIIESIKKL